MRAVEHRKYVQRPGATERNKRAKLRSFLFIVGYTTRTLYYVKVTFILWRTVTNHTGYTSDKTRHGKLLPCRPHRRKSVGRRIRITTERRRPLVIFRNGGYPVQRHFHLFFVILLFSLSFKIYYLVEIVCLSFIAQFIFFCICALG